MAVTYALVQNLPSTTTGGPSTSPLGALTTLEADVVLEAPFNGTMVQIVATALTNGSSSPLYETLSAQYSPTGDGSTGVFSSYYGSFIVVRARSLTEARSKIRAPAPSTTARGRLSGLAN